MYIEGLINGEYAKWMQKTGHEFDYILTSKEECQEKGIEIEEHSFDSGDVYARVYIDCDMEETVTPKDIMRGIGHANLKMLKKAVQSPHHKISNEAASVIAETIRLGWVEEKELPLLLHLHDDIDEELARKFQNKEQ